MYSSVDPTRFFTSTHLCFWIIKGTNSYYSVRSNDNIYKERENLLKVIHTADFHTIYNFIYLSSLNNCSQLKMTCHQRIYVISLSGKFCLTSLTLQVTQEIMFQKLMICWVGHHHLKLNKQQLKQWKLKRIRIFLESCDTQL